MFTWAMRLAPRLGAFLLVVYLGWIAWEHLGPRKPAIGMVRMAVADQVAWEIAEDLSKFEDAGGSVVLLHLDGDATDYMTATLRQTLEESGALPLLDSTAMEKARDLLRLAHPTGWTLESAIEEAVPRGADLVLYGSISSFQTLRAGTRLDMELSLASTASGEVLLYKQYKVDTVPERESGVVIPSFSAQAPWLQRVIGWLLIALLLPVFSFAFLRSTLGSGSNATKAVVLTAYTLADAVLAWLLIGVDGASNLSLFTFLAFVAGALLYNARMAALAVRLETK